jgi:hypothetical protein
MVCGACNQAGTSPRREKKKKRKERQKTEDKFTNTVVDSPTLVEVTDKVVVTVEGTMVVLVGKNPEPFH